MTQAGHERRLPGVLAMPRNPQERAAEFQNNCALPCDIQLMVWAPYAPGLIQKARDAKRLHDGYGAFVVEAATESWEGFAGADPRNVERVLRGV